MAAASKESRILRYYVGMDWGRRGGLFNFGASKASLRHLRHQIFQALILNPIYLCTQRSGSVVLSLYLTSVPCLINLIF